MTLQIAQVQNRTERRTLVARLIPAAIFVLAGLFLLPSSSRAQNPAKQAEMGPWAVKMEEPLLRYLNPVRTRAMSSRQAYNALMADWDGMVQTRAADLVVATLDAEIDDTVLTLVRSTGVTILHSAPQWDEIVVEASLDQLAALADMPEIRYIKLPAPPVTRVGSVSNDANLAMKTNDARGTFAVNGAGQIVGVISDSINDTAAVGAGAVAGAVPNATLSGTTPQGSGDLPANIQVVDFGPGGGTDEGTAMLELIFDVAPGTGLAFGSSGNSQTVMANNITSLMNNANCTVIVDDIGFFGEPFFQDGPIAQSITTVVNGGVPYFTAAGNDADQGFIGSFVDINGPVDNTNAPNPNGVDFHNWGIGGATASFLPVRIAAAANAATPRRLRIILQWNQPFNTLGLGSGSEVDLDLYVYGSASTANLVSSSRTAQGNTGIPFGDPFEQVIVQNTSTAGAVTAFVAVDHFQGNQAGVTMRVLFLGSGISFPSGGAGGPTAWGHVQTDDGVPVGAIFYGDVLAQGRLAPDPNAINAESFSSEGGIGANGLPIFFDTSGNPIAGGPDRRDVPLIAAPDGTNTTFFGNDVTVNDPDGSGTQYDPDAFPNFFGTSAAAPHAASVAALMLERNNALSPAQVTEIMRKTALDIVAANPASGIGDDDRTGAGLLRGLKAVWIAGADERDDENTSEDDFVRLVFEVPEPIDLDEALIEVAYGASDPMKTCPQEGGATPLVLEADPETPDNHIRIWRKNGNEVRDARPAIDGGDYVEPDLYLPSELGLSNTTRTIDLWIEGVRESTTDGEELITFSVDPDGSGSVICKDEVRVTVRN